MTALEFDARQLLDNCANAPEFAHESLFGARFRVQKILDALTEDNPNTFALRGKMNQAVKSYRATKEYFCNQGRCW